MVAVLVLGDVETLDLAVAAARRDHRHLALEIDETFEDAGRVVQGSPRRGRVAAFCDLGLALAVVAELPRLQHRRQADCLRPPRQAARRCAPAQKARWRCRARR